jgi:hypothetical protein
MYEYYFMTTKECMMCYHRMSFLQSHWNSVNVICT